MTNRLRLFRLGEVDYDSAWCRQQETAAAVREGGEEALFLLQHHPVFTFGRRVRPEHLLIDPSELEARGAVLVESDRGGDITFHGPGQIVGYPILNLRTRGIGPNEYVRRLEEVLIRAIGSFGLQAERRPGRPGVWLGNAKVAAIGVRLQGGVSTHGFALNVDTDLSWFAAIVPCGIMDAGVTSLEQALGGSPGIPAVEQALIAAFAAVFDVELIDASAASPTGNEAVLAHGS